VGALGYVNSFRQGGKIVICKVDPADVVCVPYDSSQQKMRVCKYLVVGFFTGQLPDTLVHDADLPVHEKTVVVKSKKQEERAQKKPMPTRGKLSDERVLTMSLSELRSYASNELHLVGASKLKGGKWALLELVLSNR
jgi:hypothetical protein